jgi:hypothetical protein
VRKEGEHDTRERGEERAHTKKQYKLLKTFIYTATALPSLSFYYIILKTHL